MVPVLSAAWLLVQTAIAVWALWSWFAFQARLNRALTSSLARLQGLEVDVVASEAEHAAILDVLDKAWADTHGGEHAWGQFAATVVVVDGRPRSTRSAELFLTSMRLEGEDRSIFLPARSVPAVQAVLVQLGVIGFVVIVGMVIWAIPLTGFGFDAAITWATLAVRGATFGLVPLVAGYALGWLVRGVAERGSSTLEAQRVHLCAWLDDRYRPVTSIELLVRILDAVSPGAVTAQDGGNGQHE